MEDEDSGIIVAEDDDNLVGFIAYSNDYPRFYKGLMKHHLLKFAFCSVGAAIKHPSFIRRLWGAFKKSDSVVKSERYVELASICVNPCIENRGIGTQLIDYLKSIVDFNTYAYINLETDADGNDNVNSFYVKNGFKLERTYTTAEGRRMNEYRYVQGVYNNP
nr:GNAT family N-acetyltransferase [uncultured Butyrivibrio sp.]